MSVPAETEILSLPYSNARIQRYTILRIPITASDFCCVQEIDVCPVVTVWGAHAALHAI